MWKNGKIKNTKIDTIDITSRVYKNSEFDVLETTSGELKPLGTFNTKNWNKAKKEYRLKYREQAPYMVSSIQKAYPDYDKELKDSIKNMENEISKMKETFNTEQVNKNTQSKTKKQNTLEQKNSVTTEKNQEKAPKNDSTYFGVIDVKSNDVLNMRIKPNYKTTLVAKIPHDATCLEEIEVDINSGKTGWMKVRYKNNIGWVSVKFLELDDRCP